MSRMPSAACTGKSFAGNSSQTPMPSSTSVVWAARARRPASLVIGLTRGCSASITCARRPLATFQVMVLSLREKLTTLVTSACMMRRTNSTMVCSVVALWGRDCTGAASAGTAIRLQFNSDSRSEDCKLIGAEQFSRANAVGSRQKLMFLFHDKAELLPFCGNFLTCMFQVKISARGAKRIRNGHLWVYRSDVRELHEAEGGAIVRVVDDASNFVGRAFYSDASEIALRFLTTREETIDREWWRSRLQRCAQLRGGIAQETNAYRLVYSEGDLLSSLIVDVYDEVMVMQNLSQGSERVKSDLVELLSEEFSPRAIVERNDARVRGLEGLELRTGYLYGGAPDQIEINQHGVRFLVSPLGGQKTGAFLDQRENYLAARSVAHGRALDCFTFNGGFALHIASACKNVLGIDISAEAIAAAERNAVRNSASNVEFRAANVFDAMREFEAGRERFDTIIL